MGLKLLKTTWDMKRHFGPDQKVLLLPVAVLQRFERFQGLFEGCAPGCHCYNLFDPSCTADERMPCAAASPAGAPNPFPGLASLAVSACLQWTKTSTTSQCVT